MNTRAKATVGGIVVVLVLLSLTAGLLFAQTPPPMPTPTVTATPGPAVTHEQIHQMMDAMHGAGASQRMHEAMGPDAEKMMDQCVAMMNMMQTMSGMMGSMAGMMGSQHSRSMQDIMDRMMGR